MSNLTLKELVKSTTWFQELVQEEAMKLLNELLSDGDSPVPEKAERFVDEGLRLTWHYVDPKDTGKGVSSMGPRGQELKVVKGPSRGNVFYWWLVTVDNVEIAKTPTQKAGKLRAEEEVL